MALRYSRYIPVLHLAGDYIILNIVFVFGFIFYNKDISSTHLLLFVYLNIIWLILVILFGAYQFKRHIQKKDLVLAYTKIIVFFFFLFLLFFQFISLNYFPRSYFDFLFPGFFILILLWKMGLFYFFLYLRNKGLNFRKAIIIGHSSASNSLYSYFLNNKWYGYKCLGFLAEKKHQISPYLGNFNELESVIVNHDIDEVFLDLDTITKEQRDKLITKLVKFPLQIRIVPQLGLLRYKYFELTKYGNIPVIELHPGPLSYWFNQLLKRAVDVVLSLVVILSLLSWLTPLVYLLDYLDGRKGLFFVQQRTSINGKIFKIIKYKSMKTNNFQDEERAKLNDERITTIGKFLRKSSLDELPQFINVLLGQMSVVGPRPHMIKHTKTYNKVVNNFMLRHSVKPGITGLAQVNGYRGEVKKISDIKNRVKMDVYYIENWTLNLDLKIIAKTALLLFRSQKEAR